MQLSLSVAAVLAVAAGATASPEARIVGGTTTKAPTWMVSLRSETLAGHHVCGGILIDKDWIMVAGHCLAEKDDYTAYIGGTHLSNSSEFQKIKVDQTFVHPDYDGHLQYNDIALGHLAKSSTKKVAIMNKKRSNEATGTMVYAAGWGVTSFESSMLSETLRRVQMPVTSQSVCEKAMYFPAGTRTTICAGFKEGGKDACLGDSGGPLYINNTVIGVTSFGRDCAKPNLYGVYSRVSYYYKWIQEVMDSYE